MYRDRNVVPAGFFANGEEAKTEMEKQTRDPAPWSEADVLFFPGDLILDETRYLRADAGCCGLIGNCGFNVFCANGHAIGTQITDCCTLNVACIPRANLVFDTPAN